MPQRAPGRGSLPNIERLLAAMSLNPKSPHLLHVARDSSLIALSLLFLPLSAFITAIAFLLTIPTHQDPPPLHHDGQQISVLVTGVGMAKGLFLARAFHIAGCRVIGADFEKHGVPACGRFSAAVTRFYALRILGQDRNAEAYVNKIVDIIRKEKIDIWVSCSGVATALEDARAMQVVEKSTSCKAFQFDEDTTFKLDDKFEFMKQTERIGLLSPKWYPLSTPEALPDTISLILSKVKTGTIEKYIVKNVGMDDLTRGALPILSSNDPQRLTEVLNTLDYSGGKSWILQEYIEGGEEYCTHSVVVDGRVKAFLACPSSSVLLHYQLMDESSPLFNDMLQFTQKYAKGMFLQQQRFTGHLSFDFLAQLKLNEGGVEKVLKPIECNPRCHTATVHFRGSEGALVDAYLSCLARMEDENDIVYPLQKTKDVSYYWIAHDLCVLFLLPYLQVSLGNLKPMDVIRSQLEFWRHVTLWKDPAFEWWDPLPWLALNHICWPWNLAVTAWYGIHWSQLNVSTMKVFVVRRE